MILHIPDTRSWQCAQEIKEILTARGGHWLIWVTDDEGSFMCPAESRQAQVMLKYWSEEVAGIFSDIAPTSVISRSMSLCRWQSDGERKRTSYPRGAALRGKRVA